MSTAKYNPAHPTRKELLCSTATANPKIFNKDLRQLMARDFPEWRVTLTGGGHWRLTHPAGVSVFAPATPSDSRGLLNVRAKLRRVTATEV